MGGGALAPSLKGSWGGTEPELGGQPRMSSSSSGSSSGGTAEALSDGQDSVALLAEIERLKGENEVKGRFIATLGHEIKNPVSVILGAATILRDPVATEAKRATMIQVIERNALYLNEFIEDALAKAAYLRGTFPSVLQPLDLVPVLSQLVESYAILAQRKNLQIQMRGDLSSHWILGDQRRLQQTFSNLLMNAMKFTPTGGRVTLTVTVNQPRLSIEVADSGIGLTPEQATRVFDEFWKADGGRTSGLGLGLAIVQSIVADHGGTVSVRSDGPNRGTTFTVEFPLAQHKS